MASKKPRLAVWKFASCDGCQLSILDCEDELLALAEAVEISNFLEASRAVSPGPYDLSLVEGSITTPHDAERIHEIRRASKLLVTIGACATAGGLQALRNFADVGAWLRSVYSNPEVVATLKTSTPISNHVRVDFELPGCPVRKEALIDVVSAVLRGTKPVLPSHGVCVDCKRAGVVCVTVARGLSCLGPVTLTGCGALCPSFGRGCFGCFGPVKSPATDALAPVLKGAGLSDDDLVRLYRTFHAAAEPFRKASEVHEHAAR
ncbi:MAG: oxidoreductase [Thermoanaerobaculia bacterium]